MDFRLTSAAIVAEATASSWPAAFVFSLGIIAVAWITISAFKSLSKL